MQGVLSPPYLEAVSREHRAFKTPFSFSYCCFREASGLPQQPSEAPRDCFGLSEEKEELFTHTRDSALLDRYDEQIVGEGKCSISLCFFCFLSLMARTPDVPTY